MGTVVGRYGSRVIALVIFLLFGCASSPPVSVSHPDAEVVMGRFVVNLVQDGREQSNHGKFRWLSLLRQQQFEIFSPFGQSQMRVLIEGEDLTLEMPGRPSYTGAQAHELLQKTLGFELPFKDFFRWLQRLPGESTPLTVEKTVNNQISTIHQNGWVIDYLESQTPNVRRINLRDPRHQLELKLVLDAAEQVVEDATNK